MKTRLGLILLFAGDFRSVNVAFANVTSFTAISAKLMQGDQDVTSTYITSTISSQGNLVTTDVIGGKAAIPAGNYRYFITGTYGSKTRTWYWDVLVLPLDASLVQEIPGGDYNPFIEEFTMYEGDAPFKSIVAPGLTFTAADGYFKQDAGDVTSTYCNGTVTPSGDTISTHNIGGALSVPAGDYGYFVTGTYNNSTAKTTWFYRVKVQAKQSII